MRERNIRRPLEVRVKKRVVSLVKPFAKGFAVTIGCLAVGSLLWFVGNGATRSAIANGFIPSSHILDGKRVDLGNREAIIIGDEPVACGAATCKAVTLKPGDRVVRFQDGSTDVWHIVFESGKTVVTGLSGAQIKVLED